MRWVELPENIEQALLEDDVVRDDQRPVISIGPGHAHEGSPAARDDPLVSIANPHAEDFGPPRVSQ